MTTDEAKQWLNRYRDASMAVKRLESQLAEVRANMDGVRAIQYSDMPKSPSVSGDLSDAVALVTEMEADIATRKAQAITTMREVMEVIEQVESERQRAVLNARYIEQKSWHKIARDIGYELSYVFRIHGMALLSVINMVEKEAIENNT